MSIKVTCTCGKVLVVPDEAAGKQGKCPACGAIVDVPIFGDDRDEKPFDPGRPVGHETRGTVPATKPFLEQVALAFRYPITTKGVLVLIFGALVYEFLFILGLGLFAIVFSLVGWGYLSAFFLSIVQSSAGGEKEMPGLPDINEFMDEVVKPFFWMVGAVAFSALPQMIYAFYCALTEVAFSDRVLTYLGIWTAVYFPMAAMSVAIWRSVGAVSPHIVIPTILKIPAQHLLMSALVLVIWHGAIYALAHVSVWAAEHRLGVFLSLYLIFFVLLYFICVIGRVIGMTHWIYHNRIGWFPDRD